jgi:hypothetical protein
MNDIGVITCVDLFRAAAEFIASQREGMSELEEEERAGGWRVGLLAGGANTRSLFSGLRSAASSSYSGGSGGQGRYTETVAPKQTEGAQPERQPPAEDSELSAKVKNLFGRGQSVSKACYILVHVYITAKILYIVFSLCA